MGSTCWLHFVPYEDDVEAALQAARQVVFESGDFYLRDPFWRDMTPADYDNAPEEIRAEMLEWLDTMQALPDPTTIEELPTWNGEKGTHSILDIESIAEYQVFGTASRMTRNELIATFGTDQPDRATIERNEPLLYALRDNWIATYVIVYEAGQPSELCFFGCTGS